MTIARKSALKAAPKAPSVTVSNLAATVLGRSRVTESPTFTTQQMTFAFPAFNADELEYAVEELVDKGLVTRAGRADSASYTLTPRGREARISIA
jgi:hypothetical protein